MESSATDEVEAALDSARRNPGEPTDAPVRRPFGRGLQGARRRHWRSGRHSDARSATERSPRNWLPIPRTSSGAGYRRPEGTMSLGTRELSVCIRAGDERLAIGIDDCRHRHRSRAGRKSRCLHQFADSCRWPPTRSCRNRRRIYWRTAGHWNSPVVIMAPVGGYKPGLAHSMANRWKACSRMPRWNGDARIGGDAGGC